jgi:ParB family chromosome partitioning protein
MAGMTKVPVIIKHINNLQALEFAIVENVQRADLSPIEEANGYKQLIAEFNYTQDEIAKKIGHSRSRIANSLRLLSLPKQVQDMIDKGLISAGHGRAIVGRDDVIDIANRIVDESLSVREVEELNNEKPTKKPDYESKPKILSKRAQKSQHFKTLETDLSKIVNNLKVKINFDNKKNKGKIVIFYNQIEAIEKLIEKLKK